MVTSTQILSILFLHVSTLLSSCKSDVKVLEIHPLDLSDILNNKYDVNILSTPIFEGESKTTDDTVKENIEKSYTLFNKEGREFHCSLASLDSDPNESVNSTVLNNSSEVVNAEHVLNSLALNQECALATKEWWSYKVCFGRNVDQFHWDAATRKVVGVTIELGKFDYQAEISDVTSVLIDKSAAQSHLSSAHFDSSGFNIFSSVPKTQMTSKSEGSLPEQSQSFWHFSQFFKNGSKCDLVGDVEMSRETEVRYRCDQRVGVETITDIREPSSCKYIIDISTPKLCVIKKFRPQAVVKLREITCRPFIKKDEIPKYKMYHAEQDMLRTAKKKKKYVKKIDKMMRSLKGEDLTMVDRDNLYTKKNYRILQRLTNVKLVDKLMESLMKSHIPKISTSLITPKRSSKKVEHFVRHLAKVRGTKYASNRKAQFYVILHDVVSRLDAKKEASNNRDIIERSESASTSSKKEDVIKKLADSGTGDDTENDDIKDQDEFDIEHIGGHFSTTSNGHKVNKASPGKTATDQHSSTFPHVLKSRIMDMLDAVEVGGEVDEVFKDDPPESGVSTSVKEEDQWNPTPNNDDSSTISAIKVSTVPHHSSVKLELVKTDFGRASREKKGKSDGQHVMSINDELENDLDFNDDDDSEDDVDIEQTNTINDFLEMVGAEDPNRRMREDPSQNKDSLFVNAKMSNDEKLKSTAKSNMKHGHAFEFSHIDTQWMNEKHYTAEWSKNLETFLPSRFDASDDDVSKHEEGNGVQESRTGMKKLGAASVNSDEKGVEKDVQFAEIQSGSEEKDIIVNHAIVQNKHHDIEAEPLERHKIKEVSKNDKTTVEVNPKSSVKEAKESVTQKTVVKPVTITTDDNHDMKKAKKTHVAKTKSPKTEL